MSGFSPYDKYVPFPMEDLLNFFNQKYERAVKGQQLVAATQEEMNKNLIRPWVPNDVNTKQQIISSASTQMLDLLKRYNYNLEQAGPQLNMIRNQAVSNPFWAAASDNYRKAVQSENIQKGLMANLKNGEHLWAKNEDVLTQPTMDANGNINQLDYEYSVIPTISEIEGSFMEGKIKPDVYWQWKKAIDNPDAYLGEGTSNMAGMGVWEQIEQVNPEKYMAFWQDPQTINAFQNQYSDYLGWAKSQGISPEQAIMNVVASGYSRTLPKVIQGHPMADNNSSTEQARARSDGKDKEKLPRIAVEVPLTTPAKPPDYSTMMTKVLEDNENFLTRAMEIQGKYKQLPDGQWVTSDANAIPANELRTRDNQQLAFMKSQRDEDISFMNSWTNRAFDAYLADPNNAGKMEEKELSLADGTKIFLPQPKVELSEDERFIPPRNVKDFMMMLGTDKELLVDLAAFIVSDDETPASEVKERWKQELVSWNEDKPMELQEGTIPYVIKQYEKSGFDKTIQQVYDQLILPEIEQPRQMARTFSDKEGTWDNALYKAIVNNFGSFPKVYPNGEVLSEKDAKHYVEKNKFQQDLWSNVKNVIPTKYWYDERSGKWIGELAIQGAKGQYDIYGQAKSGQEYVYLDISDQIRGMAAQDETGSMEGELEMFDFLHQMTNIMPRVVGKNRTIDVGDYSFPGAEQYFQGTNWRINIVKEKGRPASYVLQKQQDDGSWNTGSNYDSRNMAINTLFATLKNNQILNSIETDPRIRSTDPYLIAQGVNDVSYFNPNDPRKLAAIQFIMNREGLSLTPYPDGGTTSSGIGFHSRFNTKHYKNRGEIMYDFGVMLPDYIGTIPYELEQAMFPSEYAAILDFIWNNGVNSGKNLLNAMYQYIANDRDPRYQAGIMNALNERASTTQAAERRRSEFGMILSSRRLQEAPSEGISPYTPMNLFKK